MSTVTGYLTNKGFFVQWKQLHQRLGAGLEALLERLTMRRAQPIGPPLVALAYKIDTVAGAKCVFLPRGTIGVLLAGKVIDNLCDLLPKLSPKEYTFTANLFDCQQIIVDWLATNIFTAARIATGAAVCTLNLRAGMGKTFVAAALIARLSVRALYIVPKRPLMVQAVRDMNICFDGEVAAEYKSVSDDHLITVIVINSALDRSPEWLAQFGLIIMDEVHCYASTVRQEIFWRAQAKYMLGMSATTNDRLDGFDFVYHKHFGSPIMATSIPGFAYDDVKFDCTVRAVNYHGPPQYTRVLIGKSGYMAPYLMAAQFVEDPYRTQYVIDTVREFYEWQSSTGARHHIYIFAEELTPLDKIEHRLRAEFPDGADSVCQLVGGSNIESVRINPRVVLTTYRFGGTGISIEAMTVCIFLTPRKANMLQILARILRRGGDQTIPRYYVDIIDARTPMRRQYLSRLPAYEFYGAKISSVTVKYKQIAVPNTILIQHQHSDTNKKDED